MEEQIQSSSRAVGPLQLRTWPGAPHSPTLQHHLLGAGTLPATQHSSLLKHTLPHQLSVENLQQLQITTVLLMRKHSFLQPLPCI